jgi:XTP/dITP diphosphohydrolase
VTPVVLASANAGKLRELAALLAPLDLALVPQGEFGVQAVAETGTTFLANALLKARHAAAATQLPALADDSGLEVDALGGRPGVWSARFAGEGATDDENLKQLLQQLEGVPEGQRSARYQCVIVLVRSGSDPQPLVAHGTWEGRIAAVPRGSGGFGYDPVFVPAGEAGESRTAAQFSPAQKNKVSHRGQALRALLAGLAPASVYFRP